jgi:hypothetical protein
MYAAIMMLAVPMVSIQIATRSSPTSPGNWLTRSMQWRCASLCLSTARNGGQGEGGTPYLSFVQGAGESAERFYDRVLAEAGEAPFVVFGGWRIRASCRRSLPERIVAANRRSRTDAPHRALRNSTVRAWEAAGRPPPGHRPGEGEVILRSATFGEIRRYEAVVASPDSEGNIEAGSLWAGQGVGLVSRLQPAGEIVRDIAAEARKVVGRLSELH